MINKKAPDISTALNAVKDGDLIFFGGFGTGGVPISLIKGLTERGLKDLTIVSNNAGAGHNTIASLLDSGAVRKVICTFPYSRGS
ncbi:MAG: 3-oxoadipate CoA-transferase, partial [Proteobacteria bacterium]|nr:3-oxoadipate CoA-transferase [Pseudomonadota bacterium]